MILSAEEQITTAEVQMRTVETTVAMTAYSTPISSTAGKGP